MTAEATCRATIERLSDGVTAAFGVHTTPALLDFDGEAWGSEDKAQLGVEVITMTYCFPDLPGLEPGSAITAGGSAYIVARGPRRRGDGLEAVAILENA
jgi:hypothetical protein